jgi:predicted nucleic-acid-binding protein
MRAADTNVIVRLIIQDDAKQYAKAKRLGELWVSHVVLQETIWVLSSVYAFDCDKIGLTVSMLLAHEHVVLEDAVAVQAALEQFQEKPGLGFSDCLVLEVARAKGHLPLVTFDRNLGKLDGAERL